MDKRLISVAETLIACDDVLPLFELALNGIKRAHYEAAQVKNFLTDARIALESRLGVKFADQSDHTGISRDAMRVMLETAVADILAFKSAVFVPKERLAERGDPRRLLLATLVTVCHILNSSQFRPRSDGGNRP